MSKKHRREIVIGDNTYLWWVREDYEGYSPGSFSHAHVALPDRTLHLSYQLGQPAEKSHVTVRHLDKWRRLRSPVFGHNNSFTPRDVRELLEWFSAHQTTGVEVNYLGLEIV